MDNRTIFPVSISFLIHFRLKHVLIKLTETTIHDSSGIIDNIVSTMRKCGIEKKIFTIF